MHTHRRSISVRIILEKLEIFFFSSSKRNNYGASIDSVFECDTQYYSQVSPRTCIVMVCNHFVRSTVQHSIRGVLLFYNNYCFRIEKWHGDRTSLNVRKSAGVWRVHYSSHKILLKTENKKKKKKTLLPLSTVDTIIMSSSSYSLAIAKHKFLVDAL